MVLNASRSPCKVYNLTWSEFSSSLTSAVQNLRNQENLTDITVSAGGKIFSAHKLILSAASPLLMELLKNAKCQHPILMLAGISSSDFETILDFVYRGEISIDAQKLPSLLQAAQLLEIQALSSNAVVLNSAIPGGSHEDNARLNSNAALGKSEITSDQLNTKEPESLRNSAVRKRLSRPIEPSENVPSANSCKKTCPPKNYNVKSQYESVAQSVPKSLLPGNIVNEVDDQEDDRKIISDLPVNCKLCGVTIRQSRNLRRHIDHMHLKQKLRSKSKDLKDKTSVDGKLSALNTFKAAVGKKIEDLNNNPSTSTMLNFSEDSFTLLTEEILNCTSRSPSTSNENSISSAKMQLPGLSSKATTSAAEPLPSTLEEDSCPTMQPANVQSIDKSKSSESKISSSVQTFECSNLEDSCHMNDTTLKDLENQLFSVCFCSAVNEDV